MKKTHRSDEFMHDNAAFYEAIRDIYKRNPSLTISGLGGEGSEFALDRALLLDPLNQTAFVHCLQLLEMLPNPWKSPIVADKLHKRIAVRSNKRRSFPLGILLAAALYIGCRIEKISTGDYRIFLDGAAK